MILIMLRCCFTSYSKIKCSCYVNPNLDISFIIFDVFMLKTNYYESNVGNHGETRDLELGYFEIYI